MSPEKLEEISQLPAFIELVKKRQKLRFMMIGLMMLVFLSYLIAWAYFPEFVNLRLPSDSHVTVGIWFTVLVVVSAIGLSAYYSSVGGKSLDELNEKLLQDIRNDDKN